VGKRGGERTILVERTTADVTTPEPFFLVMSGPEAGREFSIPMGASLIGREGVEIALGFADNAVSRQHAEVVRYPDRIIISDLNSTNGLFVNDVPVKSAKLEHGNLVLVGRTTLKFINQRDVEIYKLKEILRLATTDSLTGIANKKSFMDRLTAEFSQARRHGGFLTLLLIDLDFFKRFNDTYGHLAGDEVLVNVARTINSVLRAEDLLARFGGEEFVLLAPAIEPDGALALGERIRKLIEATRIDYGDKAYRVTVSVGCATLSPNASSPTSAEGLLKQADDRLYEAKRAGRNRCAGPKKGRK
jgi:diguanylate cyclase (GGDEF)-like protein